MGDKTGIADKGLPLLRIKDLLENNQEIFIDKDNVPVSCIADINNLIFTRTGQVGFVFMGKRGVVHNNCFRIVPKDNRLHLPFLYHYLNRENVRDYLDNISAGSVQSDMTHSIFKTVEIPLPSLQEQRAIASVLSSLDDKIDLLHRQNKTLEAMGETLFRQWFVVEADEGWEDGKLGELVTITRGASPRPIVQYVKNGTVPWIKIADATGSNSFYINSTKEFIIEEGVSKSVQVFPGDLILSNSATCGLPFFVKLEGCIHDGWLLFRDFSVLSEFFVFFFLKQINRELNNVADGSVQNNLNTGILKEYKLKVPDEDTLKKFDQLYPQKTPGYIIAKTDER